MRKALLVLFLTFIFGSVLQAKAQPAQQITLRVNQQRTIPRAGLTIKFVSLLEDSRCPVDVKCVSAGNAKLEIRLSGIRRGSQTFTINTNNPPKTIRYAGYEITVTDLSPKMRSNVRINRFGYRATFEVRRA